MQTLQSLAENLVGIPSDPLVQSSVIVDADGGLQLLVYISPTEPEGGPLNTLWLNSDSTSSDYQVFKRLAGGTYSEVTEFTALYDYPVWEGEDISNPNMGEIAAHLESTDGANVHGITASGIGALPSSYASFVANMYSNLSGRNNLNAQDIYALQDDVALIKAKLEHSAMSYTHVQDELDQDWLVEHNLDQVGVVDPAILCMDVNGDAVIPNYIEKIDETAVMVFFSLPFKGRVLCIGK